jgi:hypothetical protein
VSPGVKLADSGRLPGDVPGLIVLPVQLIPDGPSAKGRTGIHRDGAEGSGVSQLANSTNALRRFATSSSNRIGRPATWRSGECAQHVAGGPAPSMGHGRRGDPLPKLIGLRQPRRVWSRTRCAGR